MFKPSHNPSGADEAEDGEKKGNKLLKKKDFHRKLGEFRAAPTPRKGAEKNGSKEGQRGRGRKAVIEV